MVQVSVIIPAYNEEKDIKKCLDSLKNQSYKDFELIIVDDGSTDKTKEIASNYGTIIEGEHKGPGFSRNLGAKKAKGKILVFVDADMTFDRDYIKNLVSPINSKVIGTTHELEIVQNISNIWSRCWGKIRVSKEEAKDVKIFRAIRKDKFLELGGFDPKYGYADDQTFWFKYKIKPIVAENTKCYHKNPESLSAVFKQSRWIGASLKNLFNIPILNILISLILLILSPLIIPVIAFRRCKRNKDYSIFGYMLIFMTIRFFGTIFGIIRRIFLGKNYR